MNCKRAKISPFFTTNAFKKRIISMQAQENNALERRVDLVIAAQDLENVVTQKLKNMQRKVKMQGFRPGKVPMNLVRQMHGVAAYNDALNEAIQREFAKTATAQKLKIVAPPRLEPQQSDNKEEVRVTAIYEVFPEFELADMADVALNRPSCEVGDAEVEKTLAILQKQRVKFESVDRPAQKEDRVVVDFVGKKDGVEFEGGKGENYPFVVGSGIMLAEFENAVVGLKKDEEKTFNLTFPKEYFQKDLAEKEVEFWVKVKDVMEPKLPEVDADFAKSLGIKDGDIQKLKAEIKENLEREVKSRLQRRIKKDVMDALIAKNPIDLPRALVQMETQRLIEGARQDMQMRGIGGKDFEIKPEWFLADATRRVHLGLILAKIVDNQKVKVEKEDVRKLVDEMAASYEKPEELVRWYYEKPERLSQLEGLALEDKVVEWVLNSAQVTDQAADFDELMKEPQRP